MRRFNFIWYIVIMITLPLGIMLLSGNLVMRTSATYVYHFNDSQVVSKLGTSINGSSFADSISGYFNSIGKEDFQVYEENGEFRDPIFDEVEAEVMGKSKNIMTVTLLSGIAFLGISVAIYAYLLSGGNKAQLRIIGLIALAISGAGVIVEDILLRSSTIRTALYDRFIEIKLSESSTLRLLLGSPFEKTYMIFSTVLAFAIILILIYIHHSITRERRLFS